MRRVRVCAEAATANPQVAAKTTLAVRTQFGFMKRIRPKIQTLTIESQDFTKQIHASDGQLRSIFLWRPLLEKGQMLANLTPLARVNGMAGRKRINPLRKR